MVDWEALGKVVEAASFKPQDVVLEVGAGSGNLTELLAEKSKVTALEKEADLVAVLRKKFKDHPKVDVLRGDALKIEYPMYNKIVSNIPYSVSRKLLERFIVEGFEEAVLVVQKEFAEKLIAQPGHDNYRMVSVLAQSTCEVEYVDSIAPQAFRPQPEVESALVVLRQFFRPLRDYIGFLNTLFSGKNRKLRNILDVGLEYAELVPRDMPPPVFRQVYASI